MTKKTEDAQQSDDIPTHDFFENLDLEDADDLEDALDNFIFAIKSDYFLCWEAVEQKEQGNSLTEVQDKVLTNLINSNDGYTGPFIYINDIARPIEPWYEIAQKIAYHFLQMPFRTYEMKYEVICKGWSVLSDILETHCQDLSLPKGAKTPLDVIPLNLLHYLNLQFCFAEELTGIGQEEEWTFENEEQYYRIDDFIQLHSLGMLERTEDQYLIRVIDGGTVERVSRIGAVAVEIDMQPLQTVDQLLGVLLQLQTFGLKHQIFLELVVDRRSQDQDEQCEKGVESQKTQKGSALTLGGTCSRSV